MQNNATELWTLLEYIAPQLFDFGEAQTLVRTTLEAWVQQEQQESQQSARKRLRHEAEVPTPSSDTCGATSPLWEATGLLQQALHPFVLRRTKQSAGLRLPPKWEVVVPVSLTPLQRQVYNRIAIEDRFMNNRMVQQQKCCLHPFLVDSQLATDMAGYPAMTSVSGKLQLLDGLLPALHAHGHRVLIFSHMTSMLDVVEDFLQAGHTSLSYVRLDGGTAPAERVRAIRLFHGSGVVPSSAAPTIDRLGNVEAGIPEDNVVFEEPANHAPARSGLRPFPINATGRPSAMSAVPIPRTPCARQRPPRGVEDPECFLFLISTKAGGSGLNLAGADTVVLLDGDFNPHTDRQAIDRCHRIGQQRPVVVYRLVCPQTVETSQLQTARGKLALESLLLGCSDAAASEVVYVRASSHNATLQLAPVTVGFDVEDLQAPPSFPTEAQLKQLANRPWLMTACSQNRLNK